MALAPGARLGPYEILAPIGGGGMGEVWKARDTRLNRLVAIKRLKAAHMARFEQEARAIAALNHPHICQIYDIGQDYLVFEYIDGRPLQGPLPVDEAARLAAQIASALETSHTAGILHRDLKPANVLVTAAGAKLVDFGLAKATSDSEGTQTIEGAVLGTAAYMSPEQAHGKPLDARSDIFSLGALLYEALAGKAPFDGVSMLDILNAVVASEPKALDSPLWPVVKRCLEKDPARRFQSAADVKAALAQIGSKSEKPSPSIAVLPFANMSGDKDQEYFSDGLAEEIINALAKIPGLKVIARTSAFAFKGQNVDIRKIAETLGVAHILEGSVRRAGTRLRVTAQLIAAADGTHVWSERFDRQLADVFEIQDEISASIVAALQFKLGRAPAQRQYTPKLAAYDALLRGRHHAYRLTPASMKEARACLEEAVAIDPGYAMPYNELARSYIVACSFNMASPSEAIPLARAANQRALEIDPLQPEALNGLALITALFDLNWKEAERLNQIAMAQAPVSALARNWYAAVLFASGRVQEALQQIAQAVEEDPLNVVARFSRASWLLATDDAAAESECHRILEISSDFYMAYYLLGEIYISQGNLAKALAASERAFSAAAWMLLLRGQYAALLRLTGDLERAKDLIRELGEGTTPGGARSYVCYYLIISEIDQAADWAGKAIEQRDWGVLYALRLPIAEPLRRSARWPKIAKMANFPEAS